MDCAKERADPFSGTRPRAEKGHCSQAVEEARTMSAMPGNQAAPPPTAGPLSARMRTLRWLWGVSVAVWGYRGVCRLTRSSNVEAPLLCPCQS